MASASRLRNVEFFDFRRNARRVGVLCGLPCVQLHILFTAAWRAFGSRTGEQPAGRVNRGKGAE